MPLMFSWDWVSFVVGGISTFAVKFLEEYSEFKKSTTKDSFIAKWKFEDWLYVILGGCFTVAFHPTDIFQAMVFGAAWESFFVRIYKEIRDKNKQNGIQ